MNNNTSLKIVIAETSVIIRSGLTAVLKRIPNLNAHPIEVSSPESLQNYIHMHPADIIIINPTFGGWFPGAPSPDTEVGPWIDAYQMQVFSTDYAPYSFYLYKQLYDAETGQPIEGLYADLDGDGEITNKDRYHHHSPAPDWILGFSTSLRYKKWTLSTSLRANIGGYIFNGMAMNTGAWETMSYNDYQLNNLNRSFLDTRFTKRQFLSDHYLENASFLKMDNLQLSYDFGRIYKTIGLHASAMVQNVFTVTKYKGVDPETANGVDTSVYPRPRTYSITIGLNF